MMSIDVRIWEVSTCSLSVIELKRSGMAGELAVRGGGSELYAYCCLPGGISTGILRYKNLPSLTDMIFPSRRDRALLGDVLAMYQNLTFKNSLPGDYPQKITGISGCCIIVPVKVAYWQLSPHLIQATIDLYP